MEYDVERIDESRRSAITSISTQILCIENLPDVLTTCLTAQI